MLGPDQRIPVERALRAITIDAAWQNFQEDAKGSIEAGKLADLVLILADNPMTVEPIKIRDINVLGQSSAVRPFSSGTGPVKPRARRSRTNGNEHAKEPIMRRTLCIVIGAVALLSLIAEAQSGGYQLISDRMKMPRDFILGTPEGAPPPAERAAMTARGERTPNISAFAGVAVDQQDNVYAFHRGMEDLKQRFPPDLRSRERPVVVWDANGNFKRWMGDGIPGGVLGPHMLEVDPEGHL